MQNQIIERVVYGNRLSINWFSYFRKCNFNSYLDPLAQEIICHFSQDHVRVLKLPDFFKNNVGPRVKESFWAYLEWLSRKWTKLDKDLQIFWAKNHKLLFFFNFLIKKTYNFMSNLNHWSSGNFFLVLHVSLPQKLTNLEFLTMNVSNVAIGQFGNLQRPNNGLSDH